MAFKKKNFFLKKKKKIFLLWRVQQNQGLLEVKPKMSPHQKKKKHVYRLAAVSLSKEKKENPQTLS